MASPDLSPSLSALVGRRVKDIRKADGLSQDQIARKLRERGLTRWTRPVVAALENGGRELGLGEFFALAAVLQRPLWELASAKSPWIRIADDSEIRTEGLRLLLQGAEPNDLLDADLPRRMPHADIDLGGSRQGGERRRKMTSSQTTLMPGLADQLAIQAQGELERRVARQTGLDPRQVAYLGNRLWQRSVSEERDRRADEQSFRKQHVSRELVQEIREAARELTQEHDRAWEELGELIRTPSPGAIEGTGRKGPPKGFVPLAPSRSRLERASAPDALRRIRELVEKNDPSSWQELASGYRQARIRRPIEAALIEVGVERVLNLIRTSDGKGWDPQLVRFLEEATAEERMRRGALGPLESMDTDAEEP